MDMNKLFADFTEYVSSMTSQQVKESLSDAMLHSMDSDELLTAEELPEMSMENTPTQSIEIAKQPIGYTFCTQGICVKKYPNTAAADTQVFRSYAIPPFLFIREKR